MKPRLLIRADASAQMGTGHVMRCIALAQAWQDMGGTVDLLSLNLPPALSARLAAESIQHLPLDSAQEDLASTCQRAAKADWVVLDGYHFPQPYVESLASAAQHLLVLDDLGDFTHGGMEIILNQNINAADLDYPQKSGSPALMLGCRMALLRREFRTLPPFRDPNESCVRVLVTLGGSDPNQVTEKVIGALQKLPTLTAKVVVGAVNPRMVELRAAASGSRIELVHGVENMVPLMDWAQVAVSAGGTSVLELASRGLPTLLITSADNQDAICQKLGAEGVMLNAGWYHALNDAQLAEIIEGFTSPGAVSRRADMSGKSRLLVDGQGALRVSREMRARAAAHSVKTRLAIPADAQRIFDWANDPITRSVSFNQTQIPWEEHLSWFTRRLKSPACHFLIAEDDSGLPFGMVRFDRQEQTATMSINLAPEARRRGLGAALILVACREYSNLGLANRIEALIKPDNSASVRAFQRAGFSAGPDTEVAGQPARLMVWD